MENLKPRSRTLAYITASKKRVHMMFLALLVIPFAIFSIASTKADMFIIEATHDKSNIVAFAYEKNIRLEDQTRASDIARIDENILKSVESSQRNSRLYLVAEIVSMLAITVVLAFAVIGYGALLRLAHNGESAKKG